MPGEGLKPLPLKAPLLQPVSVLSKSMVIGVFKAENVIPLKSGVPLTSTPLLQVEFLRVKISK